MMRGARVREHAREGGERGGREGFSLSPPHSTGSIARKLTGALGLENLLADGEVAGRGVGKRGHLRSSSLVVEGLLKRLEGVLPLRAWVVVCCFGVPPRVCEPGVCVRWSLVRRSGQR
jgi:hypothetical protein